MIKTKVLVLLICLATMTTTAMMIPASRSATVTISPSSSIPQLIIVKLKTNATGLVACSLPTVLPNGSVSSISGTLFGKIRVIINMTLTGTNITQSITLNSFTLTVTQPNQIISNSTSTAQKEYPSNLVGGFDLYPNIPIIVILSFAPVCVTGNSVSRVNYYDGQNSFIFNLP